MTSEQQLVVLLVRVAVAASVASFLSRFTAFMQMLMLEERNLKQRTELALCFAVVFGAGTAVRVISPGYQGVDLGLAGCLLAGLIGGYWTGLFSGVLISIPAMFGGEWMTMPMLAGFGLLGGLLRDISPDPEEIWHFSPVFDVLGGYRIFRKSWNVKRSGFQFLFLCSILFAVFLYEAVSEIFGSHKALHPIIPDASILMVVGYLAMVLCVAVPLKIWNSARTERKLEEQNRSLVEARLVALTNQINPHFLFNTLNSISALIRVDPNKARGVIYKLSNILRRLLRKVEAFTPLREELNFIEDYLAIEMVRFGEKLRVEKDIDPDTLNHPVPTMVLQPIIENSIRHGLANQVEGGTIVIRSRLVNGYLKITVEDDGAGIPEERLKELFTLGVGVSNVNERLRVLYQENFRVTVESQLGEGTRTEIEIPRQTSSI